MRYLWNGGLTFHCNSCGLATLSLRQTERKTAGLLLTNADDLFNLDAGGVDFFSEFTDCLVGVLIGEGVHIDPNPCGETERGAYMLGG